MKTTSNLLIPIALLILAFSSLGATTAKAANFIVTNQDTSLRAAINAANATPDADTITFDGNFTIKLNPNRDINYQPLPQITTEITIQGNGAANTIVEFDHNAAIKLRIFAVAITGKLTIDGVTVQYGLTSSDGGGILNLGSLTVKNSTIQ